MQKGGSGGNQGGRGKRGIMAEVIEWRQEGLSEKEIRDKLKDREYQGPRIAELLKNTRISAALSGALSAPPAAVAASPGPPEQEQSSHQAGSRAPCQNHNKMWRAKTSAPNPL